MRRSGNFIGKNHPQFTRAPYNNIYYATYELLGSHSGLHAFNRRCNTRYRKRHNQYARTGIDGLVSYWIAGRIIFGTVDEVLG